jgi:hypothetical protein
MSQVKNYDENGQWIGVTRTEELTPEEVSKRYPTRTCVHTYSCGHQIVDVYDGVSFDTHGHPCPECGGHL